MNRLALISDIHGNILALEAVVADLRRRNVDVVVNLGDHLSGPLWPQETAQFLMQQTWIHILGNHDAALFSQPPERHSLSDAYAYKTLDPHTLEWLRSQPTVVELEPGILLFHGTPSNNSEYLLETVYHGAARLASRDEIQQRLGRTHARLMLCGHTHMQRIVRLPENALIVNPGSVGLPAYEDDLPEPHVVESGSPHARYAVVEAAGELWKVELLAVPYDHSKAAAQARKENRPEWATALETGFMRETR